MANDLDLALRIRADVNDASRGLKKLQGDVAKTSARVVQADAAQARAAQNAARAAQNLEQAQKSGTRAAQRKAGAADEAARAALREAQAERTAARADRDAARASLQAAAANDRQAASSARAAAAGQSAAAATQGAALSTRRLGPAIQNTAFQIGDFAVQVASGTSAMRAFAQQTPQLLGGFGVVGAVAGAVVAVAAALVPVLFDFGDAAEDAADGADALTDATRDLTDATGRLERLRGAAEDVDALAKKYGDLAGQMYAVIRAQEEVANRTAQDALGGLIAALGQDIGAEAEIALRTLAKLEAGYVAMVEKLRGDLRVDFADLQITGTLAGNQAALDAREKLRERLLKAFTIDPQFEAELKRRFGLPIERLVEEVVADLQLSPHALLTGLSQQFAAAEAEISAAASRIADTFGLTEEAALAIIEAYDALKQAQGLDEQADAAERLRAALDATGAAAADQTNEQRQALDAILDSSLSAEEQLIRIIRASRQIAPGLDDAADAAAGLGRELARAASAMDALLARAQSRLAEARIRVQFQGDEAGLSAALRRLRQDEAVADVEPELIASGAPQEAIEGITRELRDTAGAAFDANEAAKKLEDQLARTGRSGAAGARAAARGMDQLRRAQEKAAAEAQKLETATRDALANYAADALESRDEIAQAFQSGFKGLEDALVRFVQTGKANFRDFANAIIADLARIAIRRAITGPLAQALGNALGGGFPAAPAAPAGFSATPALLAGFTMMAGSSPETAAVPEDQCCRG